MRSCANVAHLEVRARQSSKAEAVDKASAPAKHATCQSRVRDQQRTDMRFRLDPENARNSTHEECAAAGTPGILSGDLPPEGDPAGRCAQGLVVSESRKMLLIRTS